MQYARAQLENLGAKPYTAAYKARRAARLCKVSKITCSPYMKYNLYFFERFLIVMLFFCTGFFSSWQAFPMYDKCILTSFSEGDSFTPEGL
jgi:hypothetical protein